MASGDLMIPRHACGHPTFSSSARVAARARRVRVVSAVATARRRTAPPLARREPSAARVGRPSRAPILEATRARVGATGASRRRSLRDGRAIEWASERLRRLPASATLTQASHGGRRAAGSRSAGSCDLFEARRRGSRRRPSARDRGRSSCGTSSPRPPRRFPGPRFLFDPGAFARLTGNPARRHRGRASRRRSSNDALRRRGLPAGRGAARATPGLTASSGLAASVRDLARLEARALGATPAAHEPDSSPPHDLAHVHGQRVPPLRRWAGS